MEDKVEGGKFVNSPQLKEVGTLPLEQWESCYEQTLDLVRDLYQKCRLVHADLSEYNLLLHNKEQVYVLVSELKSQHDLGCSHLSHANTNIYIS